MDRLDEAIELPVIARTTSTALETGYTGPDGLPTSLPMKSDASIGPSTRPPSTFGDHDPLSQRAELNVSSLPPVDRGRAAWAFVAGASLLEAMIWVRSCVARMSVTHRRASRSRSARCRTTSRCLEAPSRTSRPSRCLLYVARELSRLMAQIGALGVLSRLMAQARSHSRSNTAH